MPRKKPHAKKSPSVLSVETAYQLTPSEASLRTKPAQNHFADATAISHIKRHNVAINRNRIAIYYFRSIAIETQSETAQVVQRGTENCSDFRPSQYLPGILSLEKYSNSTLNDYWKRKITSGNVYLNSSRLASPHFGPNRGAGPHLAV